jgi:putative transposase
VEGTPLSYRGHRYPADELRRRRTRAGDRWHLGEVFTKVNGEQKYLWRTAVDTARSPR